MLSKNIFKLFFKICVNSMYKLSVEVCKLFFHIQEHQSLSSSSSPPHYWRTGIFRKLFNSLVSDFTDCWNRKSKWGPEQRPVLEIEKEGEGEERRLDGQERLSRLKYKGKKVLCSGSQRPCAGMGSWGCWVVRNVVTAGRMSQWTTLS